MARIRTIKPDFFVSLPISTLRYEARLTFIGLWTHVDDAGRCVDEVRLIRSALWPLDDRTFADIDKDLDDIAGLNLIRRYTVGGRRYLTVTNWSEHQRISNPTKSKLPAPPDSGVPAESSRSPHVDVPEGSARTPQVLPEASAGTPRLKGKDFREGWEKPVTRAPARDTAGDSTSQGVEPEKPKTAIVRRQKIRCPEHLGDDVRECYSCKRFYGSMTFWVDHDWAKAETYPEYRAAQL